MNKKLIALAIAGAFAAPVAMADSGNVVIYGVASVSYDNVNGTSTGSGGVADETRSRISSNNSYIGFKGSEDLGNGLSAIWQIENAVALDQQDINNTSATATTGTQSRRNTFAGISSKTMGNLTFGVQDTPLKTSTGPLDVFKDTLADYRATFATTSVRAQNSAMYTSPDLSGFVGKVLIGAQNEAGNGNDNDPRFYSLSGTYANGPIFAALAYENGRTVSVTNVESTTKTTRLGFGYNFGDAKVGVAYVKDKADTAGTTTVDSKAWYLSGAYKMGANTLKAAYTKRDKTISGGADNGAKQWAVGVDHAMSKRTNVYALYTTTRNDSAGTYSVGGGATGIAAVGSVAGGTARGLSLGMVHSF